MNKKILLLKKEFPSSKKREREKNIELMKIEKEKGIFGGKAFSAFYFERRDLVYGIDKIEYG